MPDVFTPLPMDSDVDLHVSAQRREFLRAPASVLAAISVGGAIGALARWAIGAAFPAPAGGFPWATFTINVTGCALIGVLMVLVSEVFTGRRLVRPFFGVGILGGYTTFSTCAVDAQRLISAGHGGVALSYLAATLVAALCATRAGIALARFAVGTIPAGARPRTAARSDGGSVDDHDAERRYPHDDLPQRRRSVAPPQPRRRDRAPRP